MNEKIEQLAEQVGAIRPRGVYPTAILFYPKQLEEFAKLIILEYKKESKESRRETKRKLGYSRIGLNNV